MKKLTRDRVTDHLCKRLLADFAMIGSAEPPCQNSQQQKNPCQAFLARIEQLIDQVFLDTTVASQEVRINNSANAGSL